MLDILLIAFQGTEWQAPSILMHILSHPFPDKLEPNHYKA
jgi:hypothetical protein